ncbi:hypothetical protein KSC_066950 [Ktedonobacter sp. SOSP1-52]|nr:hypothetical protein KSC_066950 [Ktedonobacter sp. SOSP1-52]
MANIKLRMKMARFLLPKSPARKVNSGTRIESKNDPILICSGAIKMEPPVTVLTSMLQNESVEYNGGCW